MKAPSTTADRVSIRLCGEVPTVVSEDAMGRQCLDSTILPSSQGTSQG